MLKVIQFDGMHSPLESYREFQAIEVVTMATSFVSHLDNGYTFEVEARE